MTRLICAAATAISVALLASSAPAPLFARNVAAVQPQSPADLFGELYSRVELARLFPDSKTFADAQPRRSPAAIMAAYRAARPVDDAALRRFVAREFVLPTTSLPPSLPRLPLRDHIARLWPLLVRPPLSPPAYSSALALDRPYVVPGGRFREIYYWDSYFTMLGMVRDGRRADVASTVQDFADMLVRYGHIPNGSRTYYLSRSQPPFFYLMVGLLSDDQPAAYARYLDALRTEHRFWMAGAEGLRPGGASGHVVRLADGTLLNRYWDARDTPREEAYAEDVKLAADTGRSAHEVYRDIRSAAESGWDFSTRWFGDGRSFATIRTTSVAPVDLNSLLYGLEQAIATGCTRRGDAACARQFTEQAARRAEAIKRYFWDDATGAFEDLDWRTAKRMGQITAAGLMPLFTGIASRDQAARSAATAEQRLLRPGGIATTMAHSGQQWDEPNGWAPLQWIAVTGLDRYGHRTLADAIASRWIKTLAGVYRCTGRLVEKYDVDTGRPGGGGEYPVQDGFGWTNGVTRALLDRKNMPAPEQITRQSCAS